MPQADLNQDVQSAFLDWKHNYLTSSGAPAGTKRVRRGAAEQYDTVSEGIGYGLLILVYMDNGTNQTQADFDALWRYHQAYLDSHGLMNWRIDASGNVTGAGSATDADQDITLALLLAHVQWGSKGNINYFTAGKAMLDLILKNDVEANTHLLKPGDGWLSAAVTNPSYFCPAYMQIFATVSADTGWNQVLNAEYQLVQYFQLHYTTGLLPDWCQAGGLQANSYSYNFTYDACRVPWRIGWDYLNYGTTHNALAHDQPQRAAAWIQTKTGGNQNLIWDGYQLNGDTTTAGIYNNAAFVGGFAAAAMTDATLQTWCNLLYNQLRAFPTGPYYYPDTLRLLYMLLLTRNMPNVGADLSSDELPPVLSNIDVRNITAREATVVWTSDELADSMIDFGLTLAYGTQKTDATLTLQHAFALTGLVPGSRYYFRLTSKDKAGNEARSNDQTFFLLNTDQSREALAREKLLSPGLPDGINDQAFFGPEAQEVTIVNLEGREVFRQSRPEVPGATIAWAGKDQQGRLVPAGVYIARIRNRGGAVLFQKFIVAK